MVWARGILIVTVLSVLLIASQAQIQVLPFNIKIIDHAYAQSTLFVDDNTCPSTGSGTVSNPFCSIQNAINTAAAGDTIQVAAGTYTEPIISCLGDDAMFCIDKSLTIRGDPGDSAPGPGANKPIIDGGAAFASAFVFKSDASVSNVIIEGFEIRNFANNPALFTGGIGSAIFAWNADTSNIQVLDNNLHNLGWNGVLVGSDNDSIQSNWTVRRNIVSDADYAGIELTNVVNSQVSDNIVTVGSGIVWDPGDSGVGIEVAVRNRVGGVTAGTNVVVKNNSIDTDAGSGSACAECLRAGINILSRTYNTSSGNAVLQSVTIENNLISDVSTRGIFITSETRKDGISSSVNDLTIVNNTLDGNGDGIAVHDFVNGGGIPTHTGISVTENTITGNTNGIHILPPDTSADGITVSSNIIVGNTVGVDNDGTDILNAENNWWGCTDGPGEPGCDPVSAGVDFDPFLTSAPSIAMLVITATGTGVTSFTPSVGAIIPGTLAAIDPATLPVPPPTSLPQGLFAFQLSVPAGSTVTITITFPFDIPTGSAYWKFQNGQYFELPSSLIGSNDGDNILTITLTDGGIGDSDGSANGVIDDPGGPGPGVASRAGNACGSILFTNDPSKAGRCVIVDTEPPRITRAFVTPSDYLCVEALDNVRTAKVTYNGNEIPSWPGSMGFFCTNEPLPAVIKVVAEDLAGNKSEMVAINANEIVTTREEQKFTAVVAKELNPHHGVEGIVLDAKEMKQIRIAKSPDFSNGELYISEKGIMILDGKKTVEVAYKGQYGNERHGYIHIFATNIGHLATFDVIVNDDITLYKKQEKRSHGTYDLDLRNVSAFDHMNLNAFQRAELERTFEGKELNLIQKNILSMVLRLATGLGCIQSALIDEHRGFSVSTAYELNPHNGVEGIILETNIPVNQLRIVSPDFSNRELYISDKGIMTLDGKQVIEVVYKGGYGKERHGEIHVFATNMGKIATFAVIIKDDIKLYLQQGRL